MRTLLSTLPVGAQFRWRCGPGAGNQCVYIKVAETAYEGHDGWKYYRADRAIVCRSCQKQGKGVGSSNGISPIAEVEIDELALELEKRFGD